MEERKAKKTVKKEDKIKEKVEERIEENQVDGEIVKKKNNIKDKVKEKPQKEYPEHNKIIRNTVAVLGLILVIIGIAFVTVDKARNFEYRGITGSIVKEGELIFYQTSLPVIYNGKETSYDFYLRNDPRDIDKIIFEGELNIVRGIAINYTNNLNCDGKGGIALANLLSLYNVIGATYIKDVNATCDDDGRYMFIQIQESNESSIEKVGPACYNLNVNNCEILEVTERFMYETLVKVNGFLEGEREVSLKDFLQVVN